MQIEIEVKFLNVNYEEVRNKLNSLGATCTQPMRLMQRSIIDFPDRRLQTTQDGWVRVRNEGDKTTLTYKESKENVASGASEIETIVEDYEKTVEIFKAIGLVVESSQESKRETWVLDGVEVVLDEWPWLKPYIEVEGNSEQEIQKAAEQLGFDWATAVFGSTTAAYQREYPGIKEGETIGMIPVIRFSDPLPEFLESRKA